MISVPIAAATQVATKTESFGIPASPRMDGLTKMMYAIVRKVVRPASSSVRTVVPLSLSLKNLSRKVMRIVSVYAVRGSFLYARKLADFSGPQKMGVLICVLLFAASHP